MKVNVEKMPKATIKVHVELTNDEVKLSYNEVLNELVQRTTIEGFRKGNAPKEMVIEKVGRPDFNGKVVNHLLQKYYPQALKENHIIPISNPQVQIKNFDVEATFEFDAVVATKPEVKIGEFAAKLKKTHETMKADLSKENQEKIKNGEKIERDHVHMSPNLVIEALIEASEVEVPDLLVQEETDRMMARLVDQAQTVGLSMDQYLKAQNKTADQLQNDYNKMAEKNLKAEFVMAKLVVDRNITVDDKEIEETFKAAGYPEEDIKEKIQSSFEKNYIKSVLQKNKLITNLIEEIEGEKHEHN